MCHEKILQVRRKETRIATRNQKSVLREIYRPGKRKRRHWVPAHKARIKPTAPLRASTKFLRIIRDFYIYKQKEEIKI
jgi:hypothetical protein